MASLPSTRDAARCGMSLMPCRRASRGQDAGESSATMHHLLPVLTPTVHALPHPEQRQRSLTTPATTPGGGHLYPTGGLALLAPAGLAATAALWPASWAAASRTSSAARAPDNRAGRRASGVPPSEGCMCRRPDAARRITHHKWPRTSTVRSAESPGSARTRVAQVENRSHSVSSVRSPSSLPITSGSVMDAVSGAERTDRPGMGGEPIATQCCVPSRCILVASSTRPAAVAGLRVTWPGGLACRAR